MASIYAGIPLLLQDPAGKLDEFLSRHLSLEQLNLFGTMSATNDSRQSSQSNNSHVMGLPVPNWPAAPKLKLNTLYWPTGASRFAHYLAIVDDPTLELILAQTESIPAPPGVKTIAPKQLVICEGAFGSTPSANGFSVDATDPDIRRMALSVEMWPLTPRKLVGCDSFGQNDANVSKRLWILPLVDIRYFWQTMPTPSWLYSNVKITDDPVSTGIHPIEFVGTMKRKNLDLMTVGPVDSSYSPTPTLIDNVDGDATRNEKQELNNQNPATIKRYKITFQPPTPPGGGSPPPTEQTSAIPSDALAEEIEDALNALPSLRVTWQTLLNNLELIVEPLDVGATAKSVFAIGSDTFDTIAAAWGWPDRTELDRRHESVAMVLDAVAASIGRRVVRDVTGAIRIENAEWAKELYAYNLDPKSPAGGGYAVIAGGESLQFSFNAKLPPPAGIRRTDVCTGISQYTWDATATEWNLTANTCGGLCVPDSPPSRPGLVNDEVVTRRCVQMPGPYVPASVDVVMRDLSRSSKSGTFLAYTGTPTSGDWSSDAGFLVASVPAVTGIDTHTGATWSLIAPRDPREVPGWKRVIHTPTFSNKGTIDSAGDNYSKLALFVAGSVYDWLAYVYDWDFSAVQRWLPTGFDDYIEWGIGERLADGTYRAETRVQSVPPNFGVSHMLIQIGTQCPWVEDFFAGKLKETLPALESDAYSDTPGKARSWLSLPAMSLQGETEPVNERLRGTLTNRSESDIAKDANVLAHGRWCEKDVLAGGGGGSLAMVEFELHEVCCDTLTAIAQVTGVLCGGSGAKVGDMICLIDSTECHFVGANPEPTMWYGIKGWAVLRKFDVPSYYNSNYLAQCDDLCPILEEGECHWAVLTLCCNGNFCI